MRRSHSFSPSAFPTGPASHPVAADHAYHTLTLVGRLEAFARDLEDECAKISTWLLSGLAADEHGKAADVLYALKEPKAALDWITECANQCWVWQGLLQVPKAHSSIIRIVTGVIIAL